jgi:hypothetical protein
MSSWSGGVVTSGEYPRGTCVGVVDEGDDTDDIAPTEEVEDPIVRLRRISAGRAISLGPTLISVTLGLMRVLLPDFVGSHSQNCSP